MDFLEKLLKEVKEGRMDADLKGLVVDMLGADPAEVLSKTIDKINPALSGSPLEVAATLFVMENAVNVIKKHNNEVVNALYKMYKEIFTDGFEALSGSFDKKTGKGTLDIVKPDKEE